MRGLLALALLAALSACGEGEVAPNSTRYGQGPVVQGGVCVQRTRSGRLVRVARSNCPELAAGAGPRAAEPQPRTPPSQHWVPAE